MTFHKKRLKMNKKILGCLITLLVAAPAMADSTLQIWDCKLNDDKTGEDAIAVSAAWLKAAKTMDGGAGLSLTLEFPIAAATGDGAFNFVLHAANPAVWGEFTNGYPGSAAAEADEAFADVASCSRSSIYESVDIE
jgi:hypothetical protein